MKIILDTNRYSDFARGDAQVVSTVYAADLVHLPLVVLASSIAFSPQASLSGQPL